MCKSLLFKYLLLISILLINESLWAQENSSMLPNRSVDMHQQVKEQLHYNALSQLEVDNLDPNEFSIKKDQLLSLLNTRYPELVYQLENSPKQIISQQEVSKLLLAIINEEAALGNLDLDGSIWESAQASIADSEGIATLEFLYGYELFKQQKLKEAQKNFKRLTKMRKGPYEYALYYSGLASLLEQNYDTAIAQLKSIGKEERLIPHIPYYLSAAHYGKEDYATVSKYYENRITETTLFNVEEITKIVAYSNYHLNRYEATINNLNILSQYRNLTDDEKYVLGKSLQKTGQNEEGNQLLANLADQSDEVQIKQTATYEYALQLSKDQKFEEAKSVFTTMLSNKAYDKEDITYNLALLNAKTANYDKVVESSLSLLKGKYQKEAISLLSEILDHIDNPITYNHAVDAINIRTEDKSLIKSSIYKKAIAALQSGNYPEAKSYFEKLKNIDPLIEERGAVAGWKGIMAYNDGDFVTAQRLLSNYLNSKSKGAHTSKIDSELEFNAHYFSAYSAFKLKGHQNALGHFSKSLELIVDPSDIDIQEDIQLRIGDCYFLMDNYQEAKVAYNAADELQRNHRDYALWQKAVIAELENKPYDQLLLLDDIIGQHNEGKYFGRAIFSSANTLFSLNKYDKSASLYKRIANEDVPLRMKEEAIVQLGLISVNAGAYDIAESYYNQILETSNDKELQHRSHLALKEIYADYTYDTDAYLKLVEKSGSDEESSNADEIIFGLAQENFESGNYNEAIMQWNKLITEYPQSAKNQEAQFQIGIAFQKKEKLTNAMDAYRATTQMGASDWSSKAYDQMEQIAYEKNNDHQLFLQLISDRKSTFASYDLTPSQTFKATKSAIATENSELVQVFLPALFESNAASKNEKTTFLKDATSLYMKNKQWDLITSLDQNSKIKAFIDASPKFIYTRSLALMNKKDLNKAAESITESYNVLLNDPAWLAKSIILLADIYTLQDDKDNAIAALQALIETKSEVPSSLIDMAKNRLELIQPQN